MRIDRVKLIAEMARQDMKAIRLAEITGITKATITSIRSGKACYDDTGHRIAAALGVDINTLIETREV